MVRQATGTTAFPLGQPDWAAPWYGPWAGLGRQVWQAAAAPGSLAFILVGVVIVLPLIAGYTAFSYWVFRGKSHDLEYH